MMVDMMQMSDVMQHSPLGIKRAATDDLEREQRLAKRFGHMNLGMSHKNRNTITSKTDIIFVDQNRGSRFNVPVTKYNSHKSSPFQLGPCAETRNTIPSSPPPSNSDGMEIEETPNRIYISDLDAEIASLDPSSPTHPIFLPDIEKHLLGLPSSILKPSAEEENLRREKEKTMQLVIYGLPTSISIPEDKDNVRRAIEEARKRVRDRMPLGGQIEAAVKDLPSLWQRTHRRSSREMVQLPICDPDAMEL